MIITARNGDVFRIDSTGTGWAAPIANVGFLHENPEVIPAGCGPLGGQIWTAAEGINTVFANAPNGTVSVVAVDSTFLNAAETIHVIPNKVCEFGISGGAFFVTAFNSGTGDIVKFPASDFAGIGGDVLVAGESTGNGPITRITPTGDNAGYVLSNFDPNDRHHEGATFARCAPIEKTQIGGPDEVGIYSATATSFVFTIDYDGPESLVLDTVPAEFVVTDVSSTDGNATSFPNGKGNPSKSATRIEWQAPAGTNTLTVTIATRESPGGGHRTTVFKPTSCGRLPLNDGATAYQDDNHDQLPDLDGGLNPIVIVGPSNSLAVDAVQGVKPCDPDSLTAQATVVDDCSGGEIKLTWTDDNGGITSYNIFRSTSAGGRYKSGQHIASVNGATFMYTDTALSAGTYYYVVKAEDAEGDESNESP